MYIGNQLTLLRTMFIGNQWGLLVLNGNTISIVTKLDGDYSLTPGIRQSRLPYFYWLFVLILVEIALSGRS